MIATRISLSRISSLVKSSDRESDIKADPKRFAAAAERLRLAGLQAQSAIQKRDSAALIEAGAAMDAACEACHSAYWYPRTPALPLPPTH